MKAFIVPVAAMLSTVGSQAAVMLFNADVPADNVAEHAAWLAAAGVAAGDTFVDFEAVDVGTNLHGVVLAGGLTVTHPSGSALVQSSSGFLGGSNPIDTRALALRETSGAANPISLTFASPVDYVGGFDIDMPGCSLRVELSDGTITPFSLESTNSSGHSAEFWGVWRNDAARISALHFVDTSGGDAEWGLDNLEYGLVPEPASFAIVGLGLLGLAKGRRR